MLIEIIGFSVLSFIVGVLVGLHLGERTKRERG